MAPFYCHFHIECASIIIRPLSSVEEDSVWVIKKEVELHGVAD